MKNQAFFSSKDKSKKLKCRLLQFLFGALRVNTSQFMLRMGGLNMRFWALKTGFVLLTGLTVHPKKL